MAKPVISMAANWSMFERAILSELPQPTRDAMRAVFYAGATALMDSAGVIMRGKETPTQDDINQIGPVFDEVMEFPDTSRNMQPLRNFIEANRE